MRKKIDNEIEFTAYHEAGHVVAALVFGLVFEGVTIIPDEKTGSLGNIYPSVNLEIPCSERDLIERTIQFLFAGNITEVKGRNCSRGIGFVEDYRAINKLARIINEDEEVRREFLSRMQIKSVEMISKNWASVEAIKGELLIKKKICKSEIESILLRKEGVSLFK